MYSNSIDEKTTIVCFLLSHDIATPLSKKTYLDIDL